MLKVRQTADPVERNYYMQQIKILTDQIYRLQHLSNPPLKNNLKKV